ncbi:hypothetical protein [Yersinia aldovae]|uniref:hypothetical protein n=1 Tax=Yersinia aldovae TaxID=29483 RepID=UPI0011A5F67F|nr:hypothetical protein [Yersinia aldovae]
MSAAPTIQPLADMLDMIHEVYRKQRCKIPPQHCLTLSLKADDDTRCICKYPAKKNHSLLAFSDIQNMFPEESAMRKIRFTEHQFIAVLKFVEADVWNI